MRDDYPLGTIDDERSARGHRGDGAHVHFLLDRFDVVVAGGIRFARQAQLCFERFGVGQFALAALFLGVARIFNGVAEELDLENPLVIFDWEVSQEGLL